MKKRRSRACALRVLPLAACVLAGAAAWGNEQPDAGAVPWSRIEEWALGKSEANPFLPQVRPAPEPPKPAAPVETKAPEKEKPPKALPPDKRPKEPKECDEVRRKVQPFLLEALKWYDNHKDYRGAWDVCFKLEDYHRAMDYLGKIVTDPKRGELESKNPWVNEQVWRTGILVLPRISQEILDRNFNDWDAKLARNDADANWKSWYVATKEYYQTSPRMPAEIQALELKGESDPKLLWDLCDRYQNERPAANIHYLYSLYRLREWHEDFPQVTNGEVQWRLGDRFQYIRFFEEAAREYKTLIETFPNFHQVKYGEVLFRRADCLLEYGKTRPRNLAFENWMEARTLFQEFQKKYPKHPNNQLKIAPDPNVNKSECMLRLEYIANNMKGK